jgi:hypothetical protein
MGLVREILALLTAGVAQIAQPPATTFPFSEVEPAQLNCVYAGISPEDRMVSRQSVLERVRALASEDKKSAKRKKDDTTKQRDKRSVALSYECQARFNMPAWQVDEWVSAYTNAKNTADVFRSVLPKNDTDRIDQAVNSLTLADLAMIRDKKDKKLPDAGLRLMQAVFQTDKPLDKLNFAYSFIYLDSVLKIRDLRVVWADWQKAEEEKAKAKAAAKAR